MMREGHLAFDVYKKIKEGILSLAYPPGATLQERQIAERFGVSRTPVREAIQCLAQEGWLVISARRYIQVRDASTLNLRKLFDARRLLADDVVDLLFSERMHAAVSKRMRTAVAAMSDARENLFAFITVDQAFHSIAFEVLENEYLQKFWQSVSEDMIWFGMLAMDEHRYESVLQEHEEIVRAMEQGQKDAVKAAVMAHLDSTEAILFGKMYDDGSCGSISPQALSFRRGLKKGVVVRTCE